jgi:hypothetical protein
MHSSRRSHCWPQLSEYFRSRVNPRSWRSQRRLDDISLHNQARRFFEAVRLGDKRTLVALALPEARGVVQKDLENPTSRLSRILLTGSRAMRGRFMAVRAPRVVLLRHPDLVGRGDGTTVCFSDPSQAFKTPASVADLPPVESNRAEMCVFFVYAGRRWAITYDLAYPD